MPKVVVARSVLCGRSNTFVDLVSGWVWRLCHYTDYIRFIGGIMRDGDEDDVMCNFVGASERRSEVSLQSFFLMKKMRYSAWI